MRETLRQEFLNETIRNLESLQDELLTQTSETLSQDFVRRIFRRIHTIKGTAQTFGFNNLSRLAHEIENLLQAINDNSIRQTKETLSVIEESLSNLLQSCRNDKQQPAELLEKITRQIPVGSSKVLWNSLDGKIPKSLSSKLSASETKSLRAALEGEKSFYLIEVFFDFASFNQKFINFRQMLDEKGEIIAVSPSEKANAAKEIGFQLFYVTDLSSSKVKQIIAPFKAKIDFESDSSNKYSDDLTGLLANLITDCEKKARTLDKKVSFEISNQANNVARKNLILINYSLLHLLRNAVDHAIEPPAERISLNKSPDGRIKIIIFQDGNDLVLRIEDDGRGVDAEKVTMQAKKRGVIASDQILNKDETLNLIFAHGFSTSEIVSDISGRGVGLDAVKDLIEKAGGEITVETEINRGTIFEIKLPS